MPKTENPKTETEEKSNDPNAPSVDTAAMRILRPGVLARRATVAFRVTHRPFIGRYGKLEVPLTSGDRAMVLPINTTSPVYHDLCGKLGDDYNAWVGATLNVSEDQAFNQMNAVAIADSKGKPLA